MNKKGFTLIELLAVIVILAIIALIATPIILSMINNARKSAAKSSAYGYVQAIDNNIGFADAEVEGYTKINDGTYNVSSLNVVMKGKKPDSGKVKIQTKKVKNATLCINGYTVTYDGHEATVGNKCGSENLYKEALLNGADPIIEGNLVPVIIENNGTVKKANVETEWYKYADKKWANAVVLFDNTSYANGATIPESNIREYFVWIPRYKYKLFNAAGNSNANIEKPIDIVFENNGTTASNGTTNGEYLTHPAFTNFGSNGIWVGKFETSYNENTYTNSSTFLTSNPNTSSATNGANIIIKPNVRSLTNKNVSTLYNLSIEANSDLNSHMMTNMEWGAAAYLTYSIYGRCTSTTCTEVTINNVNTGYGTTSGATATYTGQWKSGTTITGCAANSIQEAQNSNVGSCTNSYNSTNGYLASTTGNISGIYDMSGGNWEYVMGVIKYSDGKAYSGNNASSNSGFNGKYGNAAGYKTNGQVLPNIKYYNLYTANSTEQGNDTYNVYIHGMLGDATKEVAGGGAWFSDYARFAAAVSPWFTRGGAWSDGALAGVMPFHRDDGGAHSYCGSRLVLAY